MHTRQTIRTGGNTAGRKAASFSYLMRSVHRDNPGFEIRRYEPRIHMLIPSCIILIIGKIYGGRKARLSSATIEKPCIHRMHDEYGLQVKTIELSVLICTWCTPVYTAGQYLLSVRNSVCCVYSWTFHIHTYIHAVYLEVPRLSVYPTKRHGRIFSSFYFFAHPVYYLRSHISFSFSLP